MSMETKKGIWARLRSGPARIRRFFETFFGMRVPELASAQPTSIGELLPYESFIEYELPTPESEGLTVVLLSDGSLGVAWSLGLVGHELLTPEQLTNQMGCITQALESVTSEKATVQIIWDSTPSSRFAVPKYAADPKTYAQRVMVERIATIKGYADNQAKGDLRCMRRQLWLTLRWQRRGRVGLDEEVAGFFGGDAGSAMSTFYDRLELDLRELREAITLLESGLKSAGLRSRRCDGPSFLALVRSGLHSTAARERGWVEFNPDESIRSQAVVEFASATPYALQLGDVQPDTLQVLSWANKPVQAYDGMMAYLLQTPEPIRMVMTMRRCTDMGDLARKELVLKYAMDAVGKRQFREVAETQERLAHNEKAFWVGLHLIVRNTDCDLAHVKMVNGGQLVANRMKEIKIPFTVETHAAPLIFRQCLPLGYSPKSGIYTQRERRVLTSELSRYLPLFSGFPGANTRSQIMQSRAGEPIYLSSRDTETSQHFVVLATSGGGKSFFHGNFLVGDRALYPDSLDFIIDNRTSYEVLANFIGEEGGCVVSKPPTTFPNIFLGELDEDRLTVMVAILRSAITLASPHVQLAAEHSVVLSDAIRRTFKDNMLDAGTRLVNGKLVREAAKNVNVPRLSQVVDKLVEVCRDRRLSLELASFLRDKLSAYVGDGPYAAIFDRECVATAEAATPAITLIDLEGVVGDPILCTLAAQISISDILRQVKRPENRGKTGRLTVEEAGVLGKGNPELVTFVQTAWKTFRNAGYICIGLTNEVDDYRLKDAAKTMWQVSPTKIILPMGPDEIAKAGTEDKVTGVPKLIQSDYYLSLIRTLRKRDGVFSQGLWLGDGYGGTFTYAPTGFDYWLAASKPEEVENVHRLAAAIGGPRPYFDAVTWLARNKPFGYRAEDRRVRAMTEEELSGAAVEIRAAAEQGVAA